MKIAILSLTTGGKDLASKLHNSLQNSTLFAGSKLLPVAEIFNRNWSKFDAFIAIMATGITVRSIAPHITSKKTDPCVLCLDEKGQYVISLLSGHIGGGNELAQKVASITGGQAVITTASDTLGLVSLDLWAKYQNLYIEDSDLRKCTAKLVNQGYLSLYIEVDCESLPKGLKMTSNIDNADIILSNRTDIASEVTVFRPRNLVIGTGCNRGTDKNELMDAFYELLNECNLSSDSVRNLASIDVKKR